VVDRYPVCFRLALGSFNIPLATCSKYSYENFAFDLFFRFDVCIEQFFTCIINKEFVTALMLHGHAYFLTFAPLPVAERELLANRLLVRQSLFDSVLNKESYTDFVPFYEKELSQFFVHQYNA
jgi:hypothetical protein